MDEITIFYSWQSDLPDNTNRKLIRDALHLLIPELENDRIRIFIDEATREEAGSPNIPITIMEKIKTSDIFIADVTIINNECDSCDRKTPNPNVVFELGFAVSILGWSRIILLLNKAYSDEKDLPFDFDRHRVTSYFAKAVKADIYKSNRNNLSSLLKEAVSIIIEQNPIKEIKKNKLTPEEIKRKRDIENIKWILSTIHQPTLQEHIESAPKIIDGSIFHFWESFRGVFESNLFHIYDKELYERICELYRAWGTSLSFGEFYINAHSNRYIFSNPLDMPLDEQQKKAWEIIKNSLNEIRNALKEINKIIRINYLEIDLKEMNSNAWNEYVNLL